MVMMGVIHGDEMVLSFFPFFTFFFFYLFLFGFNMIKLLLYPDIMDGKWK